MVGGAGGADMTTFSLHPVKAITTGEGGLVSTEDDELAQRLRMFRTHGMTREGVTRSATDGDWYHEMQALGFNYRITDFQCALGLSQLRRLDEFVARRNLIAARYRELLAEERGLALPPAAADGDLHAYHLFVVGVQGGPAVRLAVFEALRRAGIGVQVHYIPIYRHPYYRDVVGSPQDECPVAEDYYAGAISLPMFPGMSDADVERVVAELRTALP
jgi:dTDP-4-amino-4,6-dideoxygalactose transaminase